MVTEKASKVLSMQKHSTGKKEEKADKPLKIMPLQKIGN
jgi:hypothetical protein